MATSIPPDVREFAKLRLDVEAFVQRCGRQTFELLLVDGRGDWTFAVFESEDEARAAADVLGVRMREGWDPRMVQRVNRRDVWADAEGIRRAL
jgi:hypothetical protein